MDERRGTGLGEGWTTLAGLLTGRMEPEAGTGDGTADWEAVAALAKRFDVEAVLYLVLKQGDWSVPEAVRARLLDRYWATLRENLRYRSRLAAVAAAFARAGVPLIALKGLALAETVYPGLGTRPMADLDLLVRQEDVDRAAGLLEALNFRRDAPQPGDHPEAFVRGFEGEQAFHQQDAFGCTVELHWDLLNYGWFRHTTRIDLPALWQRSRPLEVEGLDLRQLAPEDNLLYLCAHLGIHHSYGSVRSLLDLHQLVCRGPALDWATCARRARELRLAHTTYFALDLTRQLFGTPVPDEVLRQLRPSAPVRWLLRPFVDPARVVNGGLHSGPQGARWLHFLLVDRWPDRLLGLLRVVFPGRQWIAARYGARRRLDVALHAVLHPLRMARLAALAVGQLLGHT